MASDKRNGRGDRSKKGPSDPRRRRFGNPFVESLEDRRLLSGSAWLATSTDPLDVQHGPLAPLGATLISIYQEYSNYVKSGSTAQFKSSQVSNIYFSGTSVGVDVRGTGDFAAFQKSLTDIGMVVTSTSPVSQFVEGYIPIANLPQLATSPQVVGALPNYKPVTHLYPFQGIGNNESANTLNVPTAVVPGVTNGTGQKIGVLSDSVNEFAGGLADSIKTGDLPGNVQVLFDAPLNPPPPAPPITSAPTDEGRAMLEQIYDIAPGAQLGFATSEGGQGVFADHIRALNAAGYKTIVDDVSYFTEPFYQDGPISVAVNDVTAQGATYLSAAGNQADSGYESQFRGVNATVGSLGAGRYLNFDPTGATTTTQLGVYVPPNAGGPQLFFQFDQPFAKATSDVTVYLLDSSGAIAYSGVTNTAATGNPIQSLVDANGSPAIASGTYTAVVRVASGADPGHIVFYNPVNENLAFDHKFGSAGQTFYPSTLGHEAAANTIGVGAVPFWGAAPYLTPSIITNEPNSSFGAVLSLFNPDGSPKTPQLLLKPDISAADANNTSFFGNPPINTTTYSIGSSPVYPGNAPTTFPTPLTPVNDAQPNLPVFQGTSSAAPNLAAVVALIKEANPTITNSQILAALDSTATPLNGSAKGVWNAQGGFGLANAAAAIATASTIAVNSISPGSAQAINQIPYSITVTFSKPVNIQTLSAGSLQVAGPNGATVTVGAPVGVDSSTFPTQVQFPILINAAPGRIANGVYTTRVAGGTIKGQDGTTLQNTFTDTFNLQQTVAPTVARTTFNGRIVTLTFATSVNPASVTPNSVYLFRAGGVNNPLFNPADQIVSNLPGAVFTYNPSTWTATIDLTNVSQANLPTDQYALVAMATITDQIGNPLNGAFSGVFPSGVFPSGNGSNFVQNLGVVNLPAPVISTLVLAPGSDSGIPGDNDTNDATPSFVGQVTALFPNTNAGLQVYAQFNGISHPGLAQGALNIGVGANGRGAGGQVDVAATTDANGRFVINYPAGIAPLPEGQNIIRVVVIGATDAPPAGLASALSTTFQIDRTLPYVGTLNGTAPTSIGENALINGLSTLSISVVDPVNPVSTISPFAVNAQTPVSALNPSTANATGNYTLDLITSTGQIIDESSFIKGATFVSTSARVLTSDPFTGRVDLTFGPGLPQGRYVLLTRASNNVIGVTDQAGNPLTNSQTNSSTGTAAPFTLDFNIQPTPTYITNYGAYSATTSGNIYGVISQPRASYEIPAAGTTPGAPAPPTAFTIDFSNQLDPTVNYANLVELVRSANSATGLPDGDFGNFGTAAGLTNPTGFTRVTGINVQLVNSISNATLGQPGYLDRLFITLPAGTTLPADYYRVYLPNVGTQAINDVYGNQLDGEFLGYQNAQGKFVDQLDTGAVRGSGQFDSPDLSGDGTPGGAFVTGFVVVPNGNVIYARPDAVYNPQLPGTYPDGSQARPYPVLAPEASYTQLNGGDLNSVVNSGVNFNPVFDRSGLGTFQPSAFFAAQEKARLTQAPVVIVAEPALSTRDPFTGVVSQRPFVLEAPAGSDPVINDASAAVPAMTTLIFASGSTLKMQNAALLVQNQGSALQIEGGANQSQLVNITSYKDSSIGGATNGDPSSVPASGDYGGILFRNFDQAVGPNGRSTLFPGQIPTTGSLVSDGRLKGPFTNPNSRTSQLDAVSGADDAMSIVNFLVEKYAGGVIPQTTGTPYDGITLQNSRPAVVNSTIAFAGSGAGAANAGFSEDVNSLRVDDVASGPLVRNDTFRNNGINGIYLRGSSATGVAQTSNATNIGTTANTFGPGQSLILNAPYPYVLTTSLVIGLGLQVENQNGNQLTNDRLYISPGSVLKFASGSGMEVLPSASINVGDTTYIRGYDGNANYGPTTAGFKANSAGLAQAIFTSFYDDTATTTYTDPNTGLTTTVTPALPVVAGGAGTNQPTPTNIPSTSRWSGLTIDSGAVGVINSAVFRYGGGALNTPNGTDNGQNSLDFHHALEIGGGGVNSIEHFNPSTGFGGNVLNGAFAGRGAHVSITNSVFNYNDDVGLNLGTDALLAADPMHPLASGNPFIHGNIFQNNGLDGVGVAGGSGLPVAGAHIPNLDVNSTWTGSDFTYILRDTIVLGPGNFSSLTYPNGFLGIPQPPSSTQLQTTPIPNVTLTLQSTLPGTILADGTVVASPGVPLIVKTLNNSNSRIFAETAGTNPSANLTQSWAGGAGFIVGADDGTDPPTPVETLIDNGAFSQIRILGIPANQSVPGSVRVPVTITSVNDNTIGTTVNGVTMNTVIPGNVTAPKAGDGGIIMFGGNSLTSYNPQDPRSGSIIDSADIKYMTRIEQQGGGIVYGIDRNADKSYTPTDSPFFDKFGVQDPFLTTTNYATQYNAPKQLTISNSNLSTFSDGGVVDNPGFGELVVNVNFPVTGNTAEGIGGGFAVSRNTAINGEPTHLYMVNDTISNMQLNTPGTTTPQGRGYGIDLIAQKGNDFPNGGVATSPAMAVILNSTFYNDSVAINSIADTFNGMNPYSHVAFLAMNNIFDLPTAVPNSIAVQAAGQQDESNLQYNLFNNYATQLSYATAQFYNGNFNNQPYTGDPAFRDAAAGNFNLLPTSAAIDRSRSELGPSVFGTMLSPSATLVKTTVFNGVPIAYDTNFLPIRNQTGDSNPFGGDSLGYTLPNDIVTLPGEQTITQRQYPDEWVPALVSAGPGVPVSAQNTSSTTPGTVGNGFNASTYGYVPIQGPRDQLGNLRIRDTASSNIGFGSNPYLDLGAFEYILQNPPVVESVVAVSANSSTTSNLYVPGGIGGINQYPSQIRVGINERLNPATITPGSVQLIGSGGDGVFGNANDINYNLANRLSFDNSTDNLIINTAGLLPTGAALNDEYEVVLKGTGSSILRDNNGLALDGNTNGGTSPLPSGVDRFPGSDFTDSFTIDTHAPTLVPGSFGLAPGTFTTAAATAGTSPLGAPIVNNNKPTFVGQITDIFPPANPVQGDQVFVDISTTGDPNNFNILGAATGTTNATGNFSVTVAQPLPDSNWNVGPDGKQGTADDTGLTFARVRVIDQAGNVSILPTAPFSDYIAAGAAYGMEIDTTPPRVTSLTPTSGTLTTPNAAGQVIVTATFSKNIDPTTLNAGSVLVTRAGGTGSFTGAGIAVPIVAGSFNITYLDSPKGAIQVTFALQGPLPNDFYRITLKGTGANPIRDVAGNALDGAGTGVPGSGDYTNSPFTVFAPGNARLIYVSNSNTALPATNDGSRANPYETIAAGMAAAKTGDDVLVLPGTYRELVQLKGQVRLLSADPSSTDTSFLPGNPLATIIYGNTSSNSTYNTTLGETVVGATNLTNVQGVPTEVSGFTILAPLVGDNVRGSIDPTSVAVGLINSNVEVDRNYIVNAGLGLNIVTSGSNVTGPQILDNVIAGNVYGVVISDLGISTTYTMPTEVINNTITDNSYGVFSLAANAGVTQAYVLNDIFYSNHDLTTSRAGTGVFSGTANTLIVGSNLFYANGVSGAPSSNATGTFANFNPAFLSSRPDAFGNILGDPAFVSPRDPRPNGDTPPVFFLYANYDLTSRSPAINAALNPVAPATDILYRKPVVIAGKGPERLGSGQHRCLLLPGDWWDHRHLRQRGWGHGRPEESGHHVVGDRRQRPERQPDGRGQPADRNSPVRRGQHFVEPRRSSDRLAGDRNLALGPHLDRGQLLRQHRRLQHQG